MFRLCLIGRSPLAILAEQTLCGWPQRKFLFASLWRRKHTIWDLHSSRMLRNFFFFTEVSGTIYQCQIQGTKSRFGTSLFTKTACLVTKTGPDTSSWKVGNYKSALRNIHQERKSPLHRVGSLKSQKVLSCVPKLSIGLAVKNCVRIDFLRAAWQVTNLFGGGDVTLYLGANSHRRFGDSYLLRLQI